MDTQTPNNSNPSHNDSNKTLMAILSYIGPLIIVPFLTGSKNDPFVKFHIKQGLIVLLTWIVASLVYTIPFFGYMIGWILWLALIVLMIIGVSNAASGKEAELPVVGQFARNFKF